MEIKYQGKLNTKKKTLWTNSNFLYLWLASAIGTIGLQMYIVAIPLLIYDMSKSALAMSTMRAIEFLPNIILGMLAGVLVDRADRKNVMSGMTLIQLCAIGGLLFLLHSEQLVIWHLFLLGFILSAAGYTFGNAQHAIVPLVVKKEQLTDANAKFSFTQTLLSLIGPGIAGMLIAAYSYKISFTIYFFCLFFLLFLIRFLYLPPIEKKTSKDTTIIQEMKEGLIELFGNKTLLVPTIVILMLNFFSSLVLGVLIFFAADYLGANEKQIGFMLSMSAVGGLVGSLLIPYLRKHFPRGKIFVSCFLFDITGLIVLVVASSWWMVGISLFIRMIGTMMLNIVYFTIRQEFTPNHLLGRVAGTSSMLMKLASPLGFFLSGIWAEFFSVRGLFMISFIFAIIMFVKLRKHEIVQIE
ncbi:MFS transporter [Bacillus chungangensis]|uniref:MFS family permease n=1 Tax=Bacillus chungangensis TaxID=587633 RepID=A0ABT9WN72_9BACI|nr:MFS transporter [Bacillus chungangensis]MDQ0174728.1 MFS family permease [Bacillus chungangensis]